MSFTERYAKDHPCVLVIRPLTRLTMFTVPIYGLFHRKEKLGAGVGFAQCECLETFQFDLRDCDNSAKDGNTHNLICPSCGHVSNKIEVPQYTDEDGRIHGSKTYNLVYSVK